MYATTFLEWWHDGEWKRIGWTASTPRSTSDLREHGQRLADHGGHYRLVQPSIYLDGPPTVVLIYAAQAAA